MKPDHFICLALVSLSPAEAPASDEFLAFPGVVREQVVDGDTSFTPFVDLFYSAELDDERRFKLLAEAIIMSHTHEMQRLQLGWQFDDTYTLWLGRYHTPAGYWNTEYHHGTYLQTSISRPALAAFEGAGGVLPTHFTGLLFEGARAFENGSGIDFNLAAGETAVFEGRLRAVDILDPDASDSKFGTLLRVGYRPDVVADNQAGVVVGRSDFAATNSGSIEEIRQTLIGAYANWQWDEVRVIAEAMQVRSELQGGTALNTRFISSYLQGERKFTPQLTAFGRLEKTWDADDDAFLQLLPDFVVERQSLGLRYDFRQWQAFTIELAHAEDRAESREEILLQWSAVLP